MGANKEGFAMMVGICGKPGSGKDTIGSYLVSEYGFQNITIKHPIEQTVKAVFGVDDRHLYDRDAREEPLDEWPGWTVRKLLQGVAQSLRDMVGEHLWAQSLCMRSGYASNPKLKLVVTDVRTPGDVAYIRKYVKDAGGRFILMMVKRPGYGATTSGGFANHKLESYDLEPECDVLFNNDGSIAELQGEVASYLTGVGVRNLSYESDMILIKAIMASVERPTGDERM
jgi:hypothetical protein